MLTRRHVVAIVSGTALLALSTGGVAWAGSEGSGPKAGAHVSEADDATTTSADMTSTTVGDTSTTLPEDTSTTTVEVGETTTVPETTSSVAPTTTIPSSPTTVGQPCKPGWGYGDTNHCHSGPPGLAQANPRSKSKPTPNTSPKAKRKPHAG
jgi:hypothetical protein